MRIAFCGVRIALAAACVGVATLAQSTVLLDQYGVLATGDPTFTRTSTGGSFPNQTCSGSISGSYFYKTYTFNVAAGSPLNVHVSGIEGTVNLDTFVEVYTPSFNPAAPLTNCVGANDDNNSSFNSYVQLASPAAGSYTVVVTSFAPGQTGDFRVCATQTTDELSACLERAPNIPTLNEFGLGGLIALLGLASGWIMRRRRVR